MSMQKTIKCIRCHNDKIVPSDWTHKECVKCHERTIRRRTKGKTPIEKIEQKAIDQLVNFENAWRRYKRNGRPFNMSKEEFREDYFKRNRTKIREIKATIAKYNSKDCPIVSHDCLSFRNLLAQRCGYVDYEQFNGSLSNKDSIIMNFHIPKCVSCNHYYVRHRNDEVKPLSDFTEEGLSEGECNKRFEDFWSIMKGKSDPFEEYERQQGFRECCSRCGTVLVNGQCPNPNCGL